MEEEQIPQATPHTAGPQDLSLNPPVGDSNLWSDAPPLDENLEDYLDHALAPLIGTLSRPQRMELRAELRGHLEALIQAYEELGEPHDRAVGLALRKFGPPRKLARRLKKSLRPSRDRSDWASIFYAAGTGMALFGGATLLAWLSLLLLGNNYTHLDVWGDYVSFVFPFIAGLLMGFKAHQRSVLGAFIGMSLLIVLNLQVGDKFIPLSVGANLNIRGMELPFFLVFVQILFWLPISCIAAGLGSKLRHSFDGGAEYQPPRMVVE